MAELFYIPICNIGGFQFLHNLNKTVTVYPFDCGHACGGSHFLHDISRKIILLDSVFIKIYILIKNFLFYLISPMDS